MKRFLFFFQQIILRWATTTILHVNDYKITNHPPHSRRSRFSFQTRACRKKKKPKGKRAARWKAWMEHNGNVTQQRKLCIIKSKSCSSCESWLNHIRIYDDSPSSVNGIRAAVPGKKEEIFCSRLSSSLGKHLNKYFRHNLKSNIFQWLAKFSYCIGSVPGRLSCEIISLMTL